MRQLAPFILTIVWVVAGATVAMRIETRTEPWHRLERLVLLGAVVVVGVLSTNIAVYSWLE